MHHKKNKTRLKALQILSAILVLGTVSFVWSKKEDLQGDFFDPNKSQMALGENQISIQVKTEDGDVLSGLKTGDFSMVPHTLVYVNETSNGNYKLSYKNQSGVIQNVIPKITVHPNGYVEQTISSGTATLDYAAKVSIKNKQGEVISTASVKTGTAFATSCKYSTVEQVYFCAIPLEETQTTISAYESNYIAGTSNFKSDRNSDDDAQQSASIIMGICSALTINPSTYVLSGKENETVSFTVQTTLTGAGRSESLILTTSGNGTFKDAKGNSGSSLTVSISETDKSTAFTYSGGRAGDIIKVILKGEEPNCKDQLILSRDIPGVSSTNTSSDSSSSDSSSSGSSNSGYYSSGNSSQQDCVDPFVDTKGHWAEDVICRMYQKGIINGRDTKHFEPNDEITRAEWLKIILMIAKFEREDAKGLKESFKDVYTYDWYYPYVSLAENQRVVRASEGPLLNPNIPITRGDAVLYAVRLADKELWGWSKEDIEFTDVKINDYFTYAIVIASETDLYSPWEGHTQLIQGYKDDSFRPYAYITRAEAMALIERIGLAWYN